MRGAQRTDRKELVVAASHRTTLSSPRLAPTLCHIFGSPPPCDSTSCALRRLPLAQVLPLGPRPRFAPMEVQRSGNDGARSHRSQVSFNSLMIYKGQFKTKWFSSLLEQVWYVVECIDTLHHCYFEFWQLSATVIPLYFQYWANYKFG
jgi:hypothetical protein